MSAFDDRRGGEAELLALRARVKELEGALARHEDTTGVEALARKRAMLAAQESERFLRQVIDLMPHFVFAKDERSRFLLVNQALADAFGAPIEDILGRTDSDFSATTEEAVHFHEDDLAVIRGGQPKVIPEERITDSTGSTRLLQTIKIPFRFGPEGTPGLLGVARDITERKLAEEALRAKTEALRTSEQMLRSVLDHFPGVVFWKDLESVYQGCNRTFSRGAGLSEPDEIIGKTDLDLPWAHSEASGYRADDREVMGSGRPKLGIVEPQLQADGRIVWFNTNKVPLFAADGSVIGVLGASLDITEMRRLEEQYRQAQKMEAVGQLAGGVAHDFNNLLQIITGYLDLAMHKLLPAHPALHELGEVARATTRASTLVRQLLTFSRRDTIRSEVIDLDQLIGNLTRMLRRMIEEHIDLRTASRGPVPRIFADPGHIEQVIVNLCVNARDAMPDGGTIEIGTTPATIGADAATSLPGAAAGQYAVLSVSDTGTGMPPDVVEHIFEPFFTTKEVGKGTGLGLATVYGIVHQHGGFIEVTSQPGRGSTFRVYLPATGEDPQGLSEPQIHA